MRSARYNCITPDTEGCNGDGRNGNHRGTGVGIPASGNAFEIAQWVSTQYGYTTGGSTISNLEIRKFPSAGICIKSDNNIVRANSIQTMVATGSVSMMATAI